VDEAYIPLTEVPAGLFFTIVSARASAALGGLVTGANGVEIVLISDGNNGDLTGEVEKGGKKG
jgi:hypothetical protein